MQLATTPSVMARPPSVHLLNRMLLAIAQQVKTLFCGLFDVEPTEVEAPSALPSVGTDVLIIGRQHRSEDAESLRFGYEVVEEAVRLGRPRYVIYVIPGLLKPDLYARDLAVLNEVAQRTPVYILEFARLSAMPMAEAIQTARRILGDNPSHRSGVPELMLPAG